LKSIETIYFKVIAQYAHKYTKGLIMTGDIFCNVVFHHKLNVIIKKKNQLNLENKPPNKLGLKRIFFFLLLFR